MQITPSSSQSKEEAEDFHGCLKESQSFCGGKACSMKPETFGIYNTE